MTQDLRDYFENAYVFLAEYLDRELVQLVHQFRQSADDLTAESPVSSEKTKTAAWRTLAESGRLAGEVAHATTEDAEQLRLEFRGLLTSA